MEHLLFRLFGPMAAWGDTAVGEVRPSFHYPSKSAVLGLVAGALGVKREAKDCHVALHENLGFAVMVLSPGELLRDYHTAQVPPTRSGRVYYSRRDELRLDKLNTILSTRDYRCDSHYLVALWRQNESTGFELPEIMEALERPFFVPYLGRKSCPLSLPMQPQLIDADTLAQAFEQARFDAIPDCELPSSQRSDVHWEQHPSPGYDQLSRSLRKDRLLSRTRWQFADRPEFTARRSD